MAIERYLWSISKYLYFDGVASLLISLTMFMPQVRPWIQKLRNAYQQHNEKCSELRVLSSNYSTCKNN